MLIRLSAFLVNLLLFCSCASDIYYKRDIKIEQLGVKLTYKDQQYPELKKVYDDELNVFINQFNSEKHIFKLNRVDSLSGTAIEVQIDKIKLVPIGQQIACFPLTVASFASLAGIPLAFTSIPMNKSKVSLLFTEQMCEQKHLTKPMTILSSRSYFGSKKAQLRRHVRRTQDQYGILFYSVESAYKAHLDFYRRSK